MDIDDIAATDFIEVDAGQRLGKVRAVFEAENPKGVTVTNDGTYEGVITERQLLQSHVEDDAKAASLSNPAPKVDRGEDVRETARMLVEGNTKVAPVFENDSLWGIVTEDDILSAVHENLDVLDVEDIYSADPITLSKGDTVGVAINRLREHTISRLPVLDERGLLTGIVTIHDVVDVVIRNMDKATTGDRAGEMDRILDIPVADVLSSPVETVSLGTAVDDAVETMLEEDYSGLVVTAADDDRTVIGVVTKTDVLRALTYTEEERMDVQITNIDLLDGITREEIHDDIEAIAGKYSAMQVQHAHVRFHQHKEQLRGTPLIQTQIRLRTDKGQAAGSGEGYGAETAFHVALDKLERNVLEMKGIQTDAEYEGQLLRKLEGF